MFGSSSTGYIAIAAVLVATLAGCSTGGSLGDSGFGDSGSRPAPGAATSGAPAPSGAPAADGRTGCLAGRIWVMDIDDAAAQLGEFMASNGMDVRAATGEGRQSFEFDETGDASASVDVTYTITVATSDLEMTVVQTHGGESRGEWAWVDDSNTVTFPAWDNAGYTIQTQVLMNGAQTDIQMDVPTASLGDRNMQIACSGTTLSTHVPGTPFTHNWNAEN